MERMEQIKNIKIRRLFSPSSFFFSRVVLLFLGEGGGGQQGEGDGKS